MSGLRRVVSTEDRCDCKQCSELEPEQLELDDAPQQRPIDRVNPSPVYL